MAKPPATNTLLIVNHADWPAHGPDLELPHLNRALETRWTQARTPSASDDLLCAAERAQAQALGWQLAPGTPTPWGAWHAEQAGLDKSADWALISPCHWDINMTGVRMDDPAQLRLDAQHSQALMAALAPLALEDGIQLHWHSPTVWLARGEVFRHLVSPSAARMADIELSEHLPHIHQDPAATRLLRRLQNEAQMLFYDHPVHDARAAERQAAVNSIWFHGAGPWVSPSKPPRPYKTIDLYALSPDLREAWLLADAWLGDQLKAQPSADILMCQSSTTRLSSQQPLAWWRRWQMQRAKQWRDALP